MSGKLSVAVVGGGLGGLAAAHALVAAGHDAHVFERTARTGGVVGTESRDGYRCELAASSFLGGPPHGALALCDALGVPVEKASKRARARWIYIDGKLQALPTSPIALARTELLTWRGKLALFAEPFARARAGGVAADESMHDFAARRFGPEVARAIIAPFVTGVYAADAHDVSVDAGFPRLAALDAAGGVVRGGIKSLFARKRGAQKTARGMHAPVGGMGALVDALAAKLGARVHRGEAIEAIEPDGGGVRLGGRPWDRAVLALPAIEAAPLVARGAPELAAKLAPFRRAAVAVVYLGVPENLVPRAADGFGFLVAKGEELRVLGVVFESTVWPNRAPPGHVLLRCIFGGGRDPEAATLPDRELIAHACRDIARAFGGAEAAPIAPSHASVARWPHGLAQYAVGHRDRVREATAVARRAKIALAGADYRGPGVNDLCADALDVVDAIEQM